MTEDTPFCLAFILVASPSSPPPSADGDGLLFANEGEISAPPVTPYADSRKADGTCHRVSCYPVSPSTACPRRLCQPPWTQPGLSEKNRILRRNQVSRNVPTQTPAALRERGVWGERRFSQRSGLSPQRPPPLRLFRREREGGGFSTEKPPPSQFFSLFLLVFNGDSAVEMRDFGRDHFPNVAGA